MVPWVGGLCQAAALPSGGCLQGRLIMPHTSRLLGIRSFSSLQDSSDRDPIFTSTGRGNRAEELELGLESLGEGSAKASVRCLHLRAGSSHRRTPFTSWLLLSPANKRLRPCSSERLLRFLNGVTSLTRKTPTTTSPVAPSWDSYSKEQKIQKM